MRDLTELKTEFRKEIRSKIAKFTPDELKASDAKITENFLALPEVQNCGRVYAYVPYGKEISTLAALSYFRKAGKYVYVCWDWPPDILPVKNDIIIVPGLTFDRKGYRIGKGGGYYDRLLEAAPGVFTVGLARDALLADSVPRETHDMSVMRVVTETQTLTING
ncbi:MAG: 5-formyltetrahydrofolate cyclo-ligase [Oscillospiraceae bacterium]|jgi:5-formyltetrahydrofolate cyclo-ligase|nr:5-formyltetrahydrofolate cyclo-ligase [Oscillospiraceae bacterium]